MTIVSLAPKQIRPNGNAPENALFLWVQNAQGQSVDNPIGDLRPIYAADEKSGQWVQVRVTRI